MSIDCTTVQRILVTEPKGSKQHEKIQPFSTLRQPPQLASISNQWNIIILSNSF